jgi:ribonucleoside-diphosphate reductase alpha chain
MGWADMLLKLKIKYSSDEAVKLAEKIMGFIRDTAYEASADLAGKRGAFPNWKVFRVRILLTNSTRAISSMEM